jgi:hypothetical protein
MYIMIKYKTIAILLLFLYLISLAFSNITTIIEYFLLHGTIPYNNIIEEEKVNITVYIKSILMILWNIFWMTYLFNRAYKIMLINIFLLISGLLVANFSITGIYFVVADIRILNGVDAAIGVFFITNYFFLKKNNFPIAKLAWTVIVISLFDAVVTIIEFIIINGSFGFRAMGMFANSQINAFILLMSISLLHVIYSKNQIRFFIYVLFYMIFSIAILMTGTRAVMLGVLLTTYILFINYLVNLYKFNVNIKGMIITGSFLMMFILLPIGIDKINSLADRGNILNQSSGGRVTKFYNIMDSLADESITNFLIGKGSGYGSNVVTSMYENINPSYKTVDGTINYIFVRNGLIGLYFLPILFFIIFKVINTIDINRTILLLNTIIISLSVNLFEIYIVMLIIGIIISYLNYYYPLRKTT